MKQERHIIRKQLIELELPSKEGAIALQRKVSRLYQEEVVKQLEQVFDGLNLNGRTLRIPKLEIDLGTIAPEQIERVFVEKCTQEIQKAIEKAARSIEGEAASDWSVFAAQDAIDCFLHFLEKGVLPWQANFKKIEALEAQVLEVLRPQKEILNQKIVHALQKRPATLQRMIQQCSISFLKELAAIIWNFSREKQQAVQARLATWLKRELKIKEQQALYNAIYQQLLQNKKITAVEIRQLEQKLMLKNISESAEAALQKLIAQQILKHQILEINHLSTMIKKIVQENKIIDRQVLDKVQEKTELIKEVDAPLETQAAEVEKSDAIQTEEAHFIENAGLVICAYFLNPLFKGFEWVEEGAFKSKALQERALHLTQYLVSGEENVAEFLLPLNKVLCGIPMNQSINRQLQLRESEKAEAQDLLQHLIQHWTILGNTSVEALRNTFLQRKGKLTYEKAFSSWLLQVEKTGYDICVERLPWTISVIKLPWMTERLQVEWI
ncbi:MAG: contractile injection system tape measure protein [Bacteroidota bacterium]